MTRLAELARLRDEILGAIRETLDEVLDPQPEDEMRYSRGYVEAYANEQVVRALRERDRVLDEKIDEIGRLVLREREKDLIIADLQTQLREKEETIQTLTSDGHATQVAKEARRVREQELAHLFAGYSSEIEELMTAFYEKIESR